MPPKLHDYQEHAVGFLHARQNAALFFDMGLGKTAITLTALTREHLPVLVNAPKRVAENVWEDERNKWRPDLRIAIAAGSPAQRELALKSNADIVVIGRDNLAQAVPHARKFRTHIIDELSGYKDRGSLRWKAAKKINSAPSMKHVWGLTGTPEPNDLLDLWAQMYLLDGGKRLGRTLTSYRQAYFLPTKRLANGTVYEWELLPGAEKAIHQRLEDLCLSEDTEGKNINLPPVTDNYVQVPLPAKARQIYKRMKNDLVVDVDLLGEIYTASNAAILSSRLEQITAGFIYPDEMTLTGRMDEYEVIHQEKNRALQEIIEGSGGGVLVGYHFRAEAAMLKKALGKQAHTVDEPDIVNRWNAGEIPVLLAHPQSAGHGLNLQHGGHTMVWHTSPWSLEEYLQMNKRLPRQGQKHPVVTHHLESPHTVDVAKRERLLRRKTAQQALLDHLASPL